MTEIAFFGALSGTLFVNNVLNSFDADDSYYDGALSVCVLVKYFMEVYMVSANVIYRQLIMIFFFFWLVRWIERRIGKLQCSCKFSFYAQCILEKFRRFFW